MKNEELENMRFEYNQLLNTRKELIDKLEKIKQLEETEEVKNYLKLREELKNDKEYTCNNLVNSSEADLIGRCISRVGISVTNNIYVHVGTYKYNLETDIVHGSYDLSVSRNDESAIYSQYKNLELRDFEGTVTIPISKREEFEKNNFIIYPKTHFKDKFFYELQIEFFKDAIEHNQQYALNKVLSKSKKN